MVKNPTSIPAEVAAYGEDGGAPILAPCEGEPVRRIDTLRTLAIGSALILAISTAGCASDEEGEERGEPATVEAASTEASEGTADETSPAAEESEDEKTSKSEGEETVESEAE